MDDNTTTTSQHPLVQINCYDQLITLTRRERNGQLCTYPIELADLGSVYFSI